MVSMKTQKDVIWYKQNQTAKLLFNDIKLSIKKMPQNSTARSDKAVINFWSPKLPKHTVFNVLKTLSSEECEKETILLFV